MGKRDEWVVDYSGMELLDAARAKKKFHEERREWWAQKKDDLIAKIKAEGVDITESVVDELAKSGYHTTSAYGGPTVQIDAGMMAQLREATQKVHAHAEKISEYDGWTQMLEDSSHKVFQVDQDDWMFFFGR